MRKLLTDSRLVFKRSASRARKEAPAVLIAPTMLAVLIVLLFDGLYGDIAADAAYPGDFIEWVAPAAVFLSVFVGAGITAATLITDFRSGYVDRLRQLTIRPGAMLLGGAAFDAVRAVATSAVVYWVAVLFGASGDGGSLGFAGMLALSAALAISWNGIFYAVALSTLNVSVIQALQPVTFMPVVMFSTFWVPPALMPDWYRSISDHNPATPIISAGRSIMFGATDWDQVAVSAVVLVGLGALTYAIAADRVRRLLEQA